MSDTLMSIQEAVDGKINKLSKGIFYEKYKKSNTNIPIKDSKTEA